MYNLYQRILDSVPQIARDDIMQKYDADPYISRTTGTAEQAKFAERLSLYMASTLNAATKNPLMLYTKNPMERLKWCEEIMKSAKDPTTVFRGATEGYKVILQFAIFVIVCVMALLIARYIGNNAKYSYYAHNY